MIREVSIAAGLFAPLSTGRNAWYNRIGAVAGL
jgi:hypothetical protein